MNFEFRIRKYDNKYTIIQPVLDGILYQSEFMDKEEYKKFVEDLKDEYENATRFLE